MKTQIRISERHSKAALLASTTAVLILVLAGVLFAAELGAPGTGNPAVAPGAPTTLTGWLHIVYGDAPRGGDHMHTHPLVGTEGVTGANNVIVDGLTADRNGTGGLYIKVAPSVVVSTGSGQVRTR